MNLKVERLDHLPVVAGLIRDLGLIEKIDARIPPYSEEKVTTGQAVAALILCGMGFLQKPLSLTPQFFENRPIGFLLGDESLQPDDFNHWKLGRELEHLHTFGIERLFAELSLEICREQGIDRTLCHGDTTSFSFSGEYKDQDDVPVQITHGYSKDFRPDLKQLVWEMAVSEDGGVPLLCAAWSGNANDSEIFHQRLQQLKEAFTQGEWPDLIAITDAKGYSHRNQLWYEHLSFVTRVPATFAAHDEWVKLAVARGEWTVLDDEKQVHFQEVEQAGERWIIVYSQAGEQRSRKQLNKAIPKEREALDKKLAALRRKSYACEADARKAAQEVLSKAKYHSYQALNVEAQVKQKGPGRPKAGAETVVDHWRLVGAELQEDTNKTAMWDVEGGCYIVATNVPSERMSAAEVVKVYNKQSTVERGFRFLKDPLFFTSGMFLKKPERIQGLLMVMTLALLVYALGERRLRQALADAEETLPNQIKQPTATPTLRWVFQMLDGINRVHLELPGRAKQCLMEGLNDLKTKALTCFGAPVCQYYQIPIPETCSM